MYDKPTDELDELLGEVTPKQMGSYLNDNASDLADDEKSFYYYYKSVIDSKNIKLKEVYISAGYSESYGGQIIRMEKHAASRDTIIRLCLGGHFGLLEINRALKLYGYNELYSKNARDAVITVAINNRRFDVNDVNEMLIGHGLEPFTIEA